MPKTSGWVPIPTPEEMARMIFPLSEDEVKSLYRAAMNKKPEEFIVAAMRWLRENRMDVWSEVMGEDEKTGAVQ